MARGLSRAEYGLILVVVLLGFAVMALITFYVFEKNSSYVTPLAPIQFEALPDATSQLLAELEIRHFAATYSFAASSLLTREWMRGIGIGLAAWLCIAGMTFVILKYRSDATLAAEGTAGKLSLVADSIGLFVILFGIALFIAVLYWRPDVTFSPTPRFLAGGSGAAAASGEDLWQSVNPEECKQCFVEMEGEIGPCIEQERCVLRSMSPSFQQ